MKFSGYLKDKGLVMFIMALVLLINAMLMAFLEIPPMVIGVTEVLSAAGYGAALVIDYYPKWKYYRELEDTLNQLEEKTYLTELVKEPRFYEGRVVHKIMKTEEKFLNDQIADWQAQLEEYYDYAQMWVHEVKTPIAVSKLMIENHKNETALSLGEEIDKIEFYVEQMLYYARCTSVEKDYRIERLSLYQITATVLKKQSKMIVGRGVWPKLVNLDYEVLSDDKWLGFILGQLVSNAVKYRAKERKPELVFSAQKEKKQIRFSIRDNGIGIARSDIENVFEKGYTGKNGRAFKKSTGMGLYLCRQLCMKMGIRIEISSEEGAWTEVTLYLQSG